MFTQMLLCQAKRGNWIHENLLYNLTLSLSLFLSIFMALATVFHSMNSLDNYPLAHSVLLVVFCRQALSTVYLFMKVSLIPRIILCG